MEVVLVSEKKTEEIERLQKAFEEVNVKAPYVKIGNIALHTKGKNTSIFFGSLDFSKFNGCFLQLDASFVDFAEPFLDELVKKGIYCQMKPESFYINSNIPFQYVVLNSKGIKVAKTVITKDLTQLDSISDEFNFPVIFKTFVKTSKTQSFVAESKRNLMAIANGIKTELDAVTVQDFIEGDLVYAAVIGEEVFAIQKKWNVEKFEHEKKVSSTILSEKQISIAVSAAKVLGLDIAVVKMINEKVNGIRTLIDFELFNKASGKDLYRAVANFYLKKIQ